MSPSENALEVDRMTIEAQRALNLPTREIGAPLAGTLIPWIDRDMPEQVAQLTVDDKVYPAAARTLPRLTKSKEFGYGE